jgi:hypothetical protein
METTSTDWEARANREAAAIIMGANRGTGGANFEVLREFVALGWLQGAIYATHLDLSSIERGTERLKEDLRQ